MLSNCVFPIRIGFDTGAQTYYMPAPYKCTVRNAWGILDGDPGDDDTITIRSGTTAVATLTFGATVAAGDVAVFARDATNGDTEFAEGAGINFLTSAAAAADAMVMIELDPHCLKQLDRDA